MLPCKLLLVGLCTHAIAKGVPPQVAPQIGPPDRCAQVMSSCIRCGVELLAVQICTDVRQLPMCLFLAVFGLGGVVATM